MAGESENGCENGVSKKGIQQSNSVFDAPSFQDNISQLKAKMTSNAKECDERNRLIKEVSGRSLL